MAQEPFDSLTPQTRRQLAQGEADSTAIKREIERTRVEMSETIGEIQERLRPDHLLQQAKDGVREAASRKGEDHHEFGERNSVRRGPAGARLRQPPGVVCQGTSDPHRDHGRRGRLVDAAQPQQRFGAVVRRSDTSWDYDEYLPTGAVAARSRQRRRLTAKQAVGEYASTAQQAVGEYASAARETVGEYASTARETVNEYAQSAASSARMASRRVRSAASTATTTVDDFVRDNPLAAGAFALAVGAAIGLAVRATEYEDRAMGATRDEALARAKHVANNLKQNVTDKVATYAEDVVNESLRDDPAASAPPMGRA